jgi:hypothetical protein
MGRDSWRISLFLHSSVVDEASFLYIACTEWSRDESSETFSASMVSVVVEGAGDLELRRQPARCAQHALGASSLQAAVQRAVALQQALQFTGRCSAGRSTERGSSALDREKLTNFDR